MNKKHFKAFCHGSLVSMIGVGTLGIMNYFVRRILSRNLPENEYGFFYSALAIVMLAIVFLDLGLGQSVTILLSKSFAASDHHESKKIFTVNFAIKCVLALVIFLGMEIAAPFLAATPSYNEVQGATVLLMIIFLLIPAQAFESVFSPVITARKAFMLQNILANIKVFIILISVFFTIKLWGIKSIAIVFAAAGCVTAFLGYKVIRGYGLSLISLKSIRKSDIVKIFSLSSWIAVSSAAISMMYYMDTICLTWLQDLKSVAMYNIALPIMQIAQSFFVFPAIFTPFVAEMWHKKDYKGIRRSCYIGNLAMLSTLPVFVLAGLYLSPFIISILFDKKFISAAPAVTILWCGMVFFSIASFNINALNSGNKQKSVAYMTIVSVIVNLTLNFILIPKFDYIGAALATAGTYLIMAIASVLQLSFVFNNKANFSFKV